MQENKNIDPEYFEMAIRLLSGNEPVEVMASILQNLFQNSFDASVYGKIREIPKKSNKKTRLFLSRGKKDGLSPRSLLRMIKNETGIGGSVINNICIKDSYSFMTVPHEDAKKIIKIYNSGKSRNKMNVKIADSSPVNKRKEDGRMIN